MTFKNIKDNTLFKFIFKLFSITVLSSVLWVMAIYFYNEHQIASNTQNIILQEKEIFSKKFDIDDLEYISNIIKTRKKIILFELYDNSLKQILNIKKDKYNILMKNILNRIDKTSNTTQYKMIPINKKDVYLYFQTKLKIKNKSYYLNILLKLDDKSISLIHNDIQWSIIIVLTTMFMVFLFIFPMIYSQYKSLIEKSDELLQSNINTLISLGDAIARRDSDTGNHNYRVTYYSIKIAEKLNLSNEQIKSLIKGAFLHDIGKIAISDTILLKPAKLSDDEFEIMKNHTVEGIEIVQNNPWLDDARDVILHHHEKVDGNGYPDGLKGNKIPYNARIFAVVDVFDALTSKRPYKKPFSLGESMQIIRDDTETHFDKKIVDIFEEIYEKMYYDISDMSSSELKNIFYKVIKPYFDVKNLQEINE